MAIFVKTCKMCEHGGFSQSRSQLLKLLLNEHFKISQLCMYTLIASFDWTLVYKEVCLQFMQSYLTMNI